MSREIGKADVLTNKNAGNASSIKLSKWRQGALLPNNLIDKLRKEGNILPQGLEADASIVAVIISQDCDVLHKCFETEPYVEIIWGSIKPGDPNCGFRWGRSVRKLHLLLVDLEAQTQKTVVEFSIHNRTRIARNLLCGFSPKTSLEFQGKEIQELRHWIIQRYSRTAWPDAFNERIHPKRNKIRKLLRAEESAHISSIFLVLIPAERELLVGEKYDLVIVSLMKEQDYDSIDKRKKAIILTDELAAALASCDDLDVLDSFCRSEADVSMAEVRKMKRWNAYDDLTLRASSASNVSPSYT